MNSHHPTIAIGTDEAGYDLKNILVAHLKELGYEVTDFGVHSLEPVLYPDIALAVAQSIAAGKHDRGVLICGTGIGVCITANKVPGIRAAVCHDPYSAQRARKSNDCQILTLGARVVAPELAKTLLEIWLDSEFEPARSGPKVARIQEIENEFHPSSQAVSC